MNEELIKFKAFCGKMLRMYQEGKYDINDVMAEYKKYSKYLTSIDEDIYSKEYQEVYRNSIKIILIEESKRKDDKEDEYFEEA